MPLYRHEIIIDLCQNDGKWELKHLRMVQVAVKELKVTILYIKYVIKKENAIIQM